MSRKNCSARRRRFSLRQSVFPADGSAPFGKRASGVKHNYAFAVNDGVAVLVFNPCSGNQPLFGILLFRDFDPCGQRVVNEHRPFKFQILRQINGAGSRKDGTEHSADQAGRNHAVGDALAELGGFGKGFVQVHRVGVVAHVGKGVDNGAGNLFGDGVFIADLNFVIRPSMSYS